MTLFDLRRICLLIQYRGEDDRPWTLVAEEEADAFWIQWRFTAMDSETGEWKRQQGRKWRLSRHAILDEVVKTAWAGVKLAIEHEAAERFTYEKEAIFHPHTDVEALVEVQQARRRVKREEQKREERP